MMTPFRSNILLFLVILACVASLWASQRAASRPPRAAVAVADHNGNPLGGVHVRGLELRTGREVTCETDDRGFCELPLAPPLRLDATKTGFHNYWFIGGDANESLVFLLEPLQPGGAQ